MRSLLQKKEGEVDKRELDPRLLMFIRNYHFLVIAIQDRIGAFPYDYYPHHFYVSAAAAADFGRMDKRLVIIWSKGNQPACRL